MSLLIVACRTSKTGEGLGNELIPWAKGFLASEELRAPFVGPSFGRNRRGYRINFRTSRFDFLLEDALLRLPHHRFTHKDYMATGEVEFEKALRKWATGRGLLGRKGFTLIAVEGMWGAFACIRNARPFLWSKMLNSRGALRNVHNVVSRLDRNKLFVVVHFRAGDFFLLKEGESIRGKWGHRVPTLWYHRVCERLVAEFGDRLQFHFVSDANNVEFRELVRKFSPNQTPIEGPPGLASVSDMLLMAQADLRVCSISAFSEMACFLSGGGLYLWYEPHLNCIDGQYSMWAKEWYEDREGSLSRLTLEQAKALKPGTAVEDAFRGYATDDDSPLPRGMIAQLHRTLLAKPRVMDLLDFGALPAWTVR